MAEAPEITERKLVGRALKLLREQAELTQPLAADAAGVTLTAWQNYEAGKRQWKPALVRKVTHALGFAPSDLDAARKEVDALPEQPVRRYGGVQERRVVELQIPVFGRARAGPTGPNVYDVGEPEDVIDIASLLGDNARALRLAGESMVPYAEPGGFVVYRLDRWPRRGQGCVIESKDGAYYVKRFERTDGAAVYVTELHPIEREIRYEMLDLKGVYAIGLRGD